MRSGAVRMVLMSRILTGDRPFIAFGLSCARAPVAKRFAPPAAAPVDNKRRAFRRFIYLLIMFEQASQTKVSLDASSSTPQTLFRGRDSDADRCRACGICRYASSRA